jgi:hypothetical protein
VRIKQAVDQMQVARSAAVRAYGELPGQMPLAARSEGGHLLVPDMHPVDLTLPTKRVVSSFKLSPTIP